MFVMKDAVHRVMRPSPRMAWVLFFLVVVIALFALQFASLHGQFLSDDYDWVRNARIRVEAHDWFDSFKTSTGGNFYRPLVAFGFEFDYAIWGYNTLGYHLHQLLFHIALVMGVAMLLWQIFKEKKIAFAIAFLFAIYPAQHEVITWIAGRPDLYAATFAIFSLAFFTYFLRSKKWWQYMLCCLFALLAFLSKEIAFVLPALAALIVPFIVNWNKRKAIAVALLFIIPLAVFLDIVLISRNTILHDPIGGYLVGGEKKGLNIQKSYMSRIFTSFIYVVNWNYAISIFGSIAKQGYSLLEKFLLHWKLMFLGASALVALMLGNIRNRKQISLLVIGCVWAVIAYIPVLGLNAYIANDLAASRLLFFSSIGYVMIWFAILWPFQGRSAWAITRTALFSLIGLLFVGLWIFNYIPWSKASNNVQIVKQSLANNTETLLEGDPNFVYVGRVPGLFYGAYEFYGVHSVRESVYEITRNPDIETFLIGNRPFAESPFCKPDNTARIAIIKWDADKKEFMSTTGPLIEKIDSAQQSTADTLKWDFTNSDVASQWTSRGIKMTQQSDGLRLEISKGNSYIESPKFPELFLGSIRSVTVKFKIIQTTEDFGGRQLTLSWPVNDEYSNGNAITKAYKETINVVSKIQTCQYPNWTLTDHVNQFRILPMTSGTVVLQSITFSGSK